MNAIGQRLGRALAAGDVVGLVGPLGAGKTTLTQGIAIGIGVGADRHVASPTFALVNQHPGRVPLLHADLYRIEREIELAELGLDETYDSGAAVIEWVDRFPSAVPEDSLRVTIAFGAGAGPNTSTRTLTFEASGPRGRRLIAAMSDAGG